MHETSIALGLLRSLSEIAEREKAKKITRVKVKIGKLSGIVIDSFKFAFDALKGEFKEVKDAELLVEEVSLVYKCKDCGREFEVDSVYFPECPACKSLNLALISGEELEVVEVELEV
ncbi:hydrogenase maturation nickel metallochaperone HypA [Phorcysia thermohydrogeniphila]|uniref:Hydrogenase maturation factor HypA n=1 Tax=Phorcysia thermohydrogeniphila TaxID=936138 RepID=A0A4R1GKL1_9BACT|nr:hydrogenase maturation nickel metallochaperone HypA [Phorcysia thermohydrogeniphila]TCK06589.1 hydrogenase nickel incorporation protein HypA/HybF [Phorcysia thermohydrogeniphila]